MLIKLKIILLCAILNLPIVVCSQSQQEDYLAIPDISTENQICFALYTVHENTLKMTAQLCPFKGNDLRDIRLEILKNNKWVTIAESKVTYPG